MAAKGARCFQKVLVLVLNSAGPRLGEIVHVRLSGRSGNDAEPALRRRIDFRGCHRGENAEENFKIRRINLFGAFSFFLLVSRGKFKETKIAEDVNVIDVEVHSLF